MLVGINQYVMFIKKNVSVSVRADPLVRRVGVRRPLVVARSRNLPETDQRKRSAHFAETCQNSLKNRFEQIPKSRGNQIPRTKCSFRGNVSKILQNPQKKHGFLGKFYHFGPFPRNEVSEFGPLTGGGRQTPRTPTL